MLLIRRVLGDSMVPTLVPGTIVLAVRRRSYRPGDIVLIHHDGLDKIKRIRDIQHRKVYVTGDNTHTSVDSRDFGWLELRHIRAKLVWPRRARR